MIDMVFLIKPHMGKILRHVEFGVGTEDVLSTFVDGKTNIFFDATKLS